MGNICGKSEDPAEAAARKNEKAMSDALENDIERARMEDQVINKLLLLGAGESGKSTLFKQMIIIYGNKFSEEDRRGYVSIIHNNILSSLQTLCQQLGKFGDASEGTPEVKAAAEKILAMRGGEPISEFLTEAVLLWGSPSIQKVYESRAQFQLTDSCKFFLDQVETAAATDWIPGEQDVLRSRVRTTGIVENDFTIDANQFKMFDVGGQRNERKKWMHCFENVTAVLFVAAISEYDQVLYEDEKTNRMEEALELFDQICNSKWFLNTSMILFLNKRDLFEDKLMGISAPPVPISVCPALKDYAGPPDDLDEAVDFIENKFLLRNQNPDKQVYYHVTCATDTGNVQAVFNAVKDIIIRRSLDEAGLV